MAVVNTIKFGEFTAAGSLLGTDIVPLQRGVIGSGATYVRTTIEQIGTYVSENLPNLIPAGGTAGQVLAKIDGTDYNVQWINGGTTGLVPYTGATQDVNLGNYSILAKNHIVSETGGIYSSAYVPTGVSYVWPQVWLTCNDQNGGGVGGINNPVCSITLNNTSTTNCFGELAFGTWPNKVGTPKDTWAFAVDPHRTNEELFKLRHTGIDILEFSADNSKITVYSNLVLDGMHSKALQSNNAAGTATFNIMRVAGGDHLQIGNTGSEIQGVEIYCGVSGKAIDIDAATGKTWIIGRTAIGQGTPSGNPLDVVTAKFVVFGGTAEGNDGQMIALGINAGAHYKIYRDTGTGLLNFDGTQTGAIGYVMRNGNLSIPNGGVTASTFNGVALTTAGGTTNFLRADGTYAAPVASAAWGGITGTLSSQTDLQTALNAKANLSGATFVGAISATNLSGTNTGDQTTITGNAGSATVLQTARTISGTGEATFTTASFNGSANVSGAVTLTNSAVIGKVLTGYVSGAGTVAATDTILQAIQKLNGNDALKANIASPTFTGTVTLPAGQSVNGVTLSTAAGTGVFLRGDGSYASPVASAAWGAITGTLSSQADLQLALDAKASLSGAVFTGDVTARSFQVSSATTSTLKTTNGSAGYGGGLALSLWNTTANNSVQLQFYNGVQDAYFGLVGSDRLAFGCSTEVMSIKSATGNVLIGTTSDNAVDKLQVQGSASFSGNITAANFPASVAEATYTGTVTWTGGAAPSGTATITEDFDRRGNTVFARINAAYATSGTTNTEVTFEWPSRWPLPAAVSGFVDASEVIMYGTGGLAATKTTNVTNNGKAAIFLNPTATGYLIKVAGASVSARVAYATFTYKAA